MSRSVTTRARQFASLSALGAAALAVGTGEAQATIIWSGPVTSGNTVGFAVQNFVSTFFKTRATVLPDGLGPAKLQIALEFAFRSRTTSLDASILGCQCSARIGAQKASLEF
jgi:hypothetical protein